MSVKRNITTFSSMTPNKITCLKKKKIILDTDLSYTTPYYALWYVKKNVVAVTKKN